MDILLAEPRGFCAGVDRAITIVEKALLQFGAPIYVRHEIVHNKYVVADLKAKGAIFIDELSEVPDDAVLIFSAHGVSKKVANEATLRPLTVFDATCPLVTKVHREVQKMNQEGRTIIMIGHQGHPEVEGTMGQIETVTTEAVNTEAVNTEAIQKVFLVEKIEDIYQLPISNGTPCAYVTQTTLSISETEDIIDALKEYFTDLIGPKKADICYATQNRQDAVALLTKNCDLILVVGSINSSNSNRLRELAEQQGIESYLIDDVADIQLNWLDDKKTVGITAGASAPESLVQEVLLFLKQQGVGAVRKITATDENTSFPLPKGLGETKV